MFDREDWRNNNDNDDDYEKVTLLDQISIAVSSPKNYRHLLKLKTSRLVLFMAVVSFLFVFMEFGIGVIFWTANVGGFRSFATETLPEFSYEDGRLSMDGDCEIDAGHASIYINTESSKVDWSELTSDGTYITVGSEYVVMGMLSGGQAYTYMSTPLKYMLVNGFNNSMLASLAPLYYVYMAFMYLMYMLMKVGGQLVLALIFSILGNGFARNLSMNLSYGKVYTVCVYAQTLPMFIMTLNNALDYMLPSTLVWIAAMIISMVFMNRAIFGSAGDVPPGSM